MLSVSDFTDQLNYFGASIAGNPNRFTKSYLDLEEMVLGGTLNLSSNVRLTQAFILWIGRYGCLLSPSKLRRLIKSGVPYEPSLLGVLIDLIEQNGTRLQNWSILKPFLKREKGRILFPNLPISKNNLDPIFHRWGWLAPPLRELEEKYLIPSPLAFKRSPELRYRAEGVSLVAADIRAWADKNPASTASLYEIAKLTSSPP